MESYQNHSSELAITLKSVKRAADRIRRCPACRSENIHTILNVAYIYDHLTRKFNLPNIVNLAEHGWHHCRDCDHRWVSKGMLQTALAPQTDTAPASKTKVIDLATHLKKSE